jgi:hypothetical protein
MGQSLMQRYQAQIAGSLSCYDRIVITGTLPQVCYPDGMTHYLHTHEIPIFDYPDFAKGLRDQTRERAETLAAEAGVEIEHIGRSRIRKEDVVARVLQQRGERPGLVHILSAMESCNCYQPWRNKATGLVSVKRRESKCLHYYFYFMDPAFGLVHLRVPTPASAGAGSGRRSACNFAAHALGPSSRGTAIAGWHANSPPPVSATPWPIMPSPGSMTGEGRSNWPTA